MFIDKDRKRINILAPYNTEYIHGIDLRSQEVRDALGITEIDEPKVPKDYTPETYYRSDQDDFPYVIYTKKSEEQIIATQLAKSKIERTRDVQNIKVTTQSGNVFDGDEMSQGRMARAIVSMTDADTLGWVLSDNTVAQVTKVELTEALRLAGQAMAMIWVKPYQS